MLKEMSGWTPSARNAALEALRARMEGNARAFYCTNRHCDGAPHGPYDYRHARSDQWPPPGNDWFAWFLSGGRGSGKTRTGAEYTRRMSHRVSRIALIAPTGADVRDTMVEGESGLLAVCALAGEKILWEPSKRRLTFSSGCIGTTFSAEKPARLRGPQFGFAWMDEPAHYDDPEEVWDMLMFGLRLGSRPHVLLTSTPLPNDFTRARIAEKETVTVRVSTYANRQNLAESFAKRLFDKYEGTRKGRQEIYGEVLPDVEGALWQEAMLTHNFEPPAMDRIVIGVDPAGTTNKRSDKTGILAVGRKGQDYYVLGDRTAPEDEKMSPQQWARASIKLYDDMKADAIVVEKNYGGDMVKATIESELKEQGREGQIRIIIVTATRSKQLRAEPVVALYEQSRVIHAGRDLAALETEMLEWVPGKGASPNRVDALVWAMTELGNLNPPASVASAKGLRIARGRSPFGRRNAA